MFRSRYTVHNFHFRLWTHKSQLIFTQISICLAVTDWSTVLQPLRHNVCTIVVKIGLGCCCAFEHLRNYFTYSHCGCICVCVFMCVQFASGLVFFDIWVIKRCLLPILHICIHRNMRKVHTDTQTLSTHAQNGKSILIIATVKCNAIWNGFKLNSLQVCNWQCELSHHASKSVFLELVHRSAHARARKCYSPCK